MIVLIGQKWLNKLDTFEYIVSSFTKVGPKKIITLMNNSSSYVKSLFPKKTIFEINTELELGVL